MSNPKPTPNGQGPEEGKINESDWQAFKLCVIKGHIDLNNLGWQYFLSQTITDPDKKSQIEMQLSISLHVAKNSAFKAVEIIESLKGNPNE